MTTIPAPGGEAPPREPSLIGQLPVTLLVGMVRFYQAFISPMSPPSCKYYPSCSQYTLIALRRHGALRGLGLALWRLLRCNPWSLGGVDDVPPARGAHTHAEG
ncbi:membrane protein insertion efficiency factor YidD [Promicromonospora soli]|uniref:Putative membrane protein insertion efficiency factor n=1 Tax=Promicromonospora soli TaxID=2035533 RepID=A0A919FR33_9MICO|nr:membrane protein insertion efficiency factor YidD [Promicromonospora soli]GHH70880.1 hypothetical protein GCM10017772_18220 [Promicromonospora soli]